MKIKKRLDVLLTERGHADTRSKAQAIIMSGLVYVDGQKADKSGISYEENVDIEVRSGGCPYVSRGGLKLEKALNTFAIDPAGYICIDCGASTGGFTDCLLQRGANHVYAVDVGYGQLAWSLRTDERVTVMERTNARNLTPDMFPEKMDMAVMDMSFISLHLVLPAVRTLLKEDGQVVCLVKPQFEAGREKVGKKGVVRDPAVHREVLENFVAAAGGLGFAVAGMSFSPVRGPEGNIEYLAWLKTAGESVEVDCADIVRQSHEVLER